MDASTVEKAVALAGTDGEFLYNADAWTGSLAIVAGDRAWQLRLDSGVPTVVKPLDEVPADDDLGEGPGDDHVIAGPAASWEQLAALPPPPGMSDLFAAAAMGAVTVSPAPATARRHLALRRFVELLGHAANGTDAAPQVAPAERAHGEHDDAVGRYLHLELDGLDHRVYYEEAGQGIGLLCQHTAGADGRQWRRLLEDRRVTSRFRVIVYDLPHHGKSLPPFGRPWWCEPYVLTQQFAMALPVTLAATLGLDRPVFMGSSVGGMLALDLARYHPDDFRAVIALEGGLRAELPEDTSAAEDSSLTGDDPAAHAAVMMMIMSPTAPEAARQETRLHYAQGAPGVFPGDINYYALEHDLRGEADQIDSGRCAVHLLTGEYDFVTVPWTERAAHEIPGATFAIMDDLGHFPMSEDHEGLMRYVLPILDGIADAARS